MPHLTIRADASSEIGSGHVMRCLTLANCMMRLGWNISLLSSIQGVPWLEQKIKNMDVDVIASDPGQLNIEQLVSLDTDFIVCDSYSYDTAELNSLSEVHNVLAIVDEPNSHLKTQLILDQNLGAELRHNFVPGTEPHYLLGSKFALVRDEILELVLSGPSVVPNLHDAKVLCFFGGTDTSGTSRKLIEAVLEFGSPTFTILAPSNVLKEISDWNLPRHVLVKPLTDELPSLIANSDAVISAAGTSVQELCTIGIPSAFVRVVENQEDNFAAISKFGTGMPIDLALDPKEIHDKVRLLCTDQELRINMFSKSRQFFDGKGANRVASAISQLIN